MMLENVLSNFGITAKVVNATQGPTVTRYEIEPAPGERLAESLILTDDIALNLAAQHIRMRLQFLVNPLLVLRFLIDKQRPCICAMFLIAVTSKMLVVVFQLVLVKILQVPVITDLAKMPHLLVAGTTGSGKSVCVNTLISSILFSRKPEEVKLLLIDPKMVELSIYNGIPHLMAPVVTDMKKQLLYCVGPFVKWRLVIKPLQHLVSVISRVITKRILKAAMPLIVLIIDELADLMMTAPDDIEESISRLAQMARAAGIHMVLATQRPSVNVITGSIKANVPSRISFAVGSQIDSRTILDMAGAENYSVKGICCLLQSGRINQFVYKVHLSLMMRWNIL